MSLERYVLALLVALPPTLEFASASAEDAPKSEATPSRQTPVEGSEKITLDQTEELNLAVGETQTLSAKDVRSYSPGVPGVADVTITPNGRQFVIQGAKPGTTTLLLIKNDNTQLTYTINVFKIPISVVERELLTILEGTTGVRVRRVGARFLIEGGVSTEAELGRIKQVAGLFPGQVESLVVLGGAAADRKLNIRVDFFFVQFDRFKSYRFGVAWPSRVAGPGIAEFSGEFDVLAGTASSAQASVVGQPLPGLDIASTHGWAKVLKHSTVITANGSEAEFSNGGEQNFLTSTGLTAGLSQVKFGTDVTVLPRFDPVTQELEVTLNATVTDLTPAMTAGTELPGRTVSTLSTRVALRLGQSIILSGIRSQSQRHSVGGLPLLSEIPILGALFGSHGDAQSEVEGAIFVVPSVIESVPTSAADLLDDAFAQYQEFSGDMDAVDVWEKRPGSVRKAKP